VVIYQLLLANKKADPLTFRIHLIKGFRVKHRSLVSHPVYGLPIAELPPKQLECHFLYRIPATGKKSRPLGWYEMFPQEKWRKFK
jgi:hypothetical protein